MYFWQAHQYLETNDEKAIFNKLKSIRIPFQGAIDQGEKLDKFSHEPYDQKQRIIASPRMGAAVVKRYDNIVDDYFAKKEMKKQKADRQIDMTAHTAILKI